MHIYFKLMKILFQMKSNCNSEEGKMTLKNVN